MKQALETAIKKAGESSLKWKSKKVSEASSINDNKKSKIGGEPLIFCFVTKLMTNRISSLSLIKLWWITIIQILLS